MYGLLKLPQEEWDTIIQNTATKKGVSAAVIEKDFWVVLTLDYLFRHSKWKNSIAFKGGTCLSKVYHLIERFSEDIDLILDWRVLGYLANEPWQQRSNTKQEAFIQESKERLFSFLKEDFLPEFKLGLGGLLGNKVNAFIEDEDPGTIIFAYPSAYKDTAILRAIRLELGVLGSWKPLRKASIRSFIAEAYPNILTHSNVDLLASTPERTFWEKATILHQEAFRKEGSLVPDRYSRHYYDLFCMSQTDVKKSALQQRQLLHDVALFKMRFYPRKWAHYELATFDSICLLPAKHSLIRLEKDYQAMKSMIYGRKPSFETILFALAGLEKEIHSLSLPA